MENTKAHVKKMKNVQGKIKINLKYTISDICDET